MIQSKKDFAGRIREGTSHAAGLAMARGQSAFAGYLLSCSGTGEPTRRSGGTAGGRAQAEPVGTYTGLFSCCGTLHKMVYRSRKSVALVLVPSRVARTSL